jgi:hypothetical protein
MIKEEYDNLGEDSYFGDMGHMACENESCSVCLQPITNPIGQECYLNHVDMWLVSHDINDNYRRIVKAHIKKRLPKNNMNSEMCFVCGKESLSLCSYCFVFLVSSVLSSLNFDKSFIEDFEYLFSYKGKEEDLLE